MIDFSENKESDFYKAGSCFVKAFVFLPLGIGWLVKKAWNRLTKRCLLIICATCLVAISMGWMFNYMYMKVQLTTAQWQRDSLQLKIDSINELHCNTVEYSRFERK